jgi:hypothetical protein
MTEYSPHVIIICFHLYAVDVYVVIVCVCVCVWGVGVESIFR